MEKIHDRERNVLERCLSAIALGAKYMKLGIIYVLSEKRILKLIDVKNKHLLLHCFYGLGVKEWLNWWFSLRCLMRLQAKYWL